jgi:hypothetical protein
MLRVRDLRFSRQGVSLNRVEQHEAFVEWCEGMGEYRDVGLHGGEAREKQRTWMVLPARFSNVRSNKYRPWKYVTMSSYAARWCCCHREYRIPIRSRRGELAQIKIFTNNNPGLINTEAKNRDRSYHIR